MTCVTDLLLVESATRGLSRAVRSELRSSGVSTPEALVDRIGCSPEFAAEVFEAEVIDVSTALWLVSVLDLPLTVS